MVGVMVALALSMFLAALDNTIVATMLPKIAERFNALANASWIVSSYIIASTALQPIYGKLCSIYGHQRVLLISHAFFVVGSVICGASKSANMLIAGRAVAGIGGSGLMSICFVVIGDIVPTAQSPMYISVFGLVWAVASVAGPVLGGVFADRTGFQWGFYINPCIQAVVVVLIVLFMRLPRPEGSTMQKLKRIDFVGVLAVVAGIVLLQLGLTWGGREYSWSSAPVVCTMVLGIIILIGFVFIEWKVPVEPLMPLHLFQRRNASLMFIAQITFGMSFFLPIFYFPIYLSVVRNSSAISSGLHLISCMLGISIMSIISGVLITKTGKYLWFIWLGTAINTAGMGLFVLLGTDPTNSMLIGIPILFGAGIGLAMQPMISCAQNAVDQEDIATTTTLFMTIRMLGSAIGLAIAQSIFQNKISPRLVALSAKYPDALKIIYGVIDNQSVIWAPGVPKNIRDDVISAYVASMHTVYLAFLAFGGLTLIVSLFAKDIPLRKTIGAAARAE
ncbi:MFS general substrate transporter [Martensiomyces pterosporus]|nr:MFS general substrate transporter [Martensiomyces pterosporus]